VTKKHAKNNVRWTVVKHLQMLSSMDVATNIAALMNWFFDVLRQMNLVGLRRNRVRQIEALREHIIVDDLSETSSLPPLDISLLTASSLIPEHLLIKRNLYENPQHNEIKSQHNEIKDSLKTLLDMLKNKPWDFYSLFTIFALLVDNFCITIPFWLL